MSYVSWDPGKAGQIGNFQGQMTGFIAGAYSLPGMANIAAAPTEVLNQNGYTVYQDADTGHLMLKRDNYPENSSIWNSQSMGVTFDCTGDTLQITGLNEKKDKDTDDADDADGADGADGSGKVDGQTDNGTTGASSFGLVTSAGNFDYSSYTNNARNSFALNTQNSLNRLSASNTAGISYASTYGLDTDETIDPVTRAVVDKEKSAAIDELNMSEATKHKFDNIEKLINKVAEKQSKAELEAVDKSGDYAMTAGIAVGAVGALAGAGKGGAIGAAIGSVIPGAGTAVGAVIGAVGGAIVGGVAGWLTGKAVKAHDESKADKANNEAAKEAQAAGDELKEALEGLSEEELIAFQRYYYQENGRKVTDDLKLLETDSDSSSIAQGAGFDSGYLSGVFSEIDDANATLKPDETVDTAVSSSNTKEITYSQAAQIEVLQQNASLYKQYWQAALQNGGSVEINGKTKTADELAQMYIQASAELETYLDGLDSGSEVSFEA